MRSSLLTLGLVLVVSLLVGSSVLTTTAASLEHPTAAETGTSVMLQQGQTGIEIAEDGSIVLEDRHEGSGLNPNAAFTFGDPHDPADAHAFVIRAESASREELLVRFVDGTGDSVEGIRLGFYLEDGTRVGQIGPGDREAVLPMAPDGTEFFVVLSVETTGVRPGGELSGRMTFTI